MTTKHCDISHFSTLTEMFFTQADSLGDAPCTWHFGLTGFRPQSWSDIATKVIKLAHSLQKLGLQKGDRVLLVSENRPEWLIADMAIMTAGGITVGTYTSNTADDHFHIIEDCKPEIVIVSTASLLRPVLAAANKASFALSVIVMDDYPRKQENLETVYSWDELVDITADNMSQLTHDAKPETHTATPDSNQTACIIYTSGTGGAPKGVMLSHKNILHNLKGAVSVVNELGYAGPGGERFLSLLPLSHAFEHTAGQFLPIALGAQIYYARAADKLVADMKLARPTIMTAVPRLYEMMRSRMLQRIERNGGLKEKLFKRTLELGTKKYRYSKLNGFAALQNGLLNILVRRKVKNGLGGALKAFVSGGAPLKEEVGLFFHALGVRLLQGYGQTEAAPVISCNRPGNIKLHTVGPVLDENITVKLADDGEILVKGDLVMQGYWNNEKATRNTIDQNGFLHTGDIGRIDDAGHIEITDRKKDIIVNSGGENVSPQRIEGMLTLHPDIAQAMVYGDDKPYLVALLVPEQALLDKIGSELNMSQELSVLSGHPALRKHIQTIIGQINQGLSVVEKIRKFNVADKPFTVENAMLTPTLKIRRHQILNLFAGRLENLYGKTAQIETSQADKAKAIAGQPQ